MKGEQWRAGLGFQPAHEPKEGEEVARVDPSQKHAAIARRLAAEEAERKLRMRAFLASGRK